jgi:ATP-dependent Lon protease
MEAIKTMKSFESKAKDYYGEVVINKGLMGKAGFGARAIPVYVGEWIISQFMDGDELTEDGRTEIVNTISKYLPQKADKNTILNRLMEQEEVRILDDFRVNVNLERHRHDLSIPLLDVSNGMVQKDIINNNPMFLKTGMWGLGTLRYVPPDGEDVKKGQIWMVEFKAFQTPGVDLDYFRDSRKHFDIDEWIDLLVSSCQFNPDVHRLSQKLLLLSRIIPLVEPRVNITELAPKGTGKSFVFDNISRYAAVIPGGKLSAPALFFNSNTKQIGLIPRYDVVVVDEIQKIHTDASGEAMAALKMYLESGRYRRATGSLGTSESGFVMLGNITLGSNRLPLYESDGIFKELPSALQESAFIDRIHGLIEGWFMPRVSRNTPSRTLGFKGDFFSEVLHELRVDLRYADYVSQSLHLPQCEDMRDNKAIARLAEGFLKLLFPDLVLSEEEFITYCVNPAVRMRQQIRDDLSKIDQEYKWVTIKSESPDEFQLSHPDEKPDPEQEAQKADPLSPDRSPEEKMLDIAEGQRGISYEKLFLPYLKGAKLIKICDPYIRLQYQIYNLMSFCEILDPSDGPLKLDLVTACDSYLETELKAKLNELKKGLSQDQIEFDYILDSTMHDRWIEADTGWRIILGRGLDIFQKPDDKFTLGFMDQSKRKCKATTITYTRTKEAL